MDFKLNINPKGHYIDSKPREIVDALTGDGKYSLDCVDITVTELPKIPEVHVVETGVLMSPMEICKCNNVVAIDFRNNDGGQCYLSKANQSVGIGKRLVISEHMYPREFYRDIQKTFDFSAIPVGSMVVINNEDCGIVVKNERGFIGLKCHKNDIDQHMWMINTNNADIKIIRIIELPKDWI